MSGQGDQAPDTVQAACMEPAMAQATVAMAEAAVERPGCHTHAVHSIILSSISRHGNP